MHFSYKNIANKQNGALTQSSYFQGIKNGYWCIVEIRDMPGCALVRDPAQVIGECRDVAKAQP